jgi:dTDP-4-amino-4,6-dideoxy-D-glucose acyltransferase
MNIGFHSEQELAEMGFRSIGKNVKLSRRASFYNCSKIEIGDDTRVDDFCIFSAGEGGIVIGKNVHIACYVSLIGKALIQIDDFAGISSKSAVYSSNDDYSGNFLTNPTVPAKFTNVKHGDVVLCKHVLVGVFVTILPGVTIHEGSAIGAYSLVTRDVEKNIIAAGVPLKKIKDRATGMYEKEVLYQLYKNEIQ